MANKNTRKLWDSPIYRFRVPENPVESDIDRLLEIVFDVTGSAPRFEEPSDELVKILKDIFTSKELKKINDVMEFGAAKLKNIPFILEQGKNVSAVEFKKLSENKYSKQNLEKCKAYGKRFRKLFFPNPFISSKKKFDLALLLNVPPVMPVFAERLYLIDLLYKKVNKGPNDTFD